MSIEIGVRESGKCSKCGTVYEFEEGEYKIECQFPRCRKQAVLRKPDKDTQYVFARCIGGQQRICMVQKGECITCPWCGKYHIVLKDFSTVSGYEVHFSELVTDFQSRIRKDIKMESEKFAALEAKFKERGSEMERLKAENREQSKTITSLEGQLRLALKNCSKMEIECQESEALRREKDLADRCNLLDRVNKEKDEEMKRLKEAKELAEKEAEKKLKEANVEVLRLKKQAEKEKEKLTRKRTFQESSDPSTSGSSSPKISHKNDNTDSERSTPVVDNAEYAPPQGRGPESVLCRCKWTVEIPPEEYYTLCANCGHTCIRKQLPECKYVQIDCEVCGPPTISCVHETQKVVECYCYRQYAICFTQILDKYDELVYPTVLLATLLDQLLEYNSNPKLQETYLETIREAYPATGCVGKMLPQPMVEDMGSE